MVLQGYCADNETAKIQVLKNRERYRQTSFSVIPKSTYEESIMPEKAHYLLAVIISVSFRRAGKYEPMSFMQVMTSFLSRVRTF